MSSEPPLLRGLTWDHPRGWAPLEALGGPVVWDRQPLEGFERHPIEKLAERYDLLVIDHPAVGEAAAAGCLVPMDGIFEDSELAGWRASAVGRTFDSYRFEGRQWALPIDAATQVSVLRPDRMGSPPTTWEEVLELAGQVPLCLSMGGPHAFLTFLALCLAGGGPVASDERLVEEGAGLAALSMLEALLQRSDVEVSMENPIGIQEIMASGDRVVLCPLVYGYVTYSSPRAGGAHRLSAHDAPRGADGSPASVLGGTGMAVSARTRRDERLVAYLRQVMSEPIQREIFASAGGQPSARSVWTDPDISRCWGGFYEQVLTSVETAWVRPRYPGFVAFQEAAAQMIRQGLEARTAHARLLKRLELSYQESRELRR